jgi:hypothetical protein
MYGTGPWGPYSRPPSESPTTLCLAGGCSLRGFPPGHEGDTRRFARNRELRSKMVMQDARSEADSDDLNRYRDRPRQNPACHGPLLSDWYVSGTST